MNSDSIQDPDLGTLTWDRNVQWWEGYLRLSSEAPFRLYVFARGGDDRAITAESRAAIERLRDQETACREYAADELLETYNDEWAEGKSLSREEFITLLNPDVVEVFEGGYAEVHFGNDDLLRGESVCVRLKADGSIQEATIEG